MKNRLSSRERKYLLAFVLLAARLVTVVALYLTEKNREQQLAA